MSQKWQVFFGLSYLLFLGLYLAYEFPVRTIPRGFTKSIPTNLGPLILINNACKLFDVEMSMSPFISLMIEFYE
jgi:hypothetical protein